MELDGVTVFVCTFIAESCGPQAALGFTRTDRAPPAACCWQSPVPSPPCFPLQLHPSLSCLSFYFPALQKQFGRKGNLNPGIHNPIRSSKFILEAQSPRSGWTFFGAIFRSATQRHGLTEARSCSAPSSAQAAPSWQTLLW